MPPRLTRVLTLRVSTDLWTQLEGLSEAWGVSPSKLTRSFIVAGLERSQTPTEIGSELRRLTQAVDELRAQLGTER